MIHYNWLNLIKVLLIIVNPPNSGLCCNANADIDNEKFVVNPCNSGAVFCYIVNFRTPSIRKYR